MRAGVFADVRNDGVEILSRKIRKKIHSEYANEFAFATTRTGVPERLVAYCSFARYSVKIFML
jgi:hypothetical protein